MPVVNDAIAAGVPVGVAPTEVANNEYFWLQTWGLAAILADGTIVINETVVPSTVVAGSVRTASLSEVNFHVGHAANVVAVSTDFQVVELTIKA